MLQVRAVETNGNITWEFLDESQRRYYFAELDEPSHDAAPTPDHIPKQRFNDGDIWNAEIVRAVREGRDRVAYIRLISQVRDLSPWESITELPGFWTDPDMLKSVLALFHLKACVLLKGSKGRGKTTFIFMVAEQLGWQHPCKVDMAAIKRATDIAGQNAAKKGSTLFQGSELFHFLKRAEAAHKAGLLDTFPVLLDEIGRVHAKATGALHGLFDDTRMITLTTAEGSITFRIPPNVVMIGTANMGYAGNFEVDEALKDRFIAINMPRIPTEEVAKILIAEAGITQQQALDIARMGEILEDLSRHAISFAPSLRALKVLAQMVALGFNMKQAAFTCLTGWLEGEITDHSSEAGKAWVAITTKASVDPDDEE